MQKVDKEKFLFLYVNEIGKALDDSQKQGICFLLDSLMVDENVNDLRCAAYMLATTRHETAGTWQPIAERLGGRRPAYSLPDPQTGKAYYGRGYVQLTWRDNYATMGRIFGMDFLHEPELVMRPEVAYKIMSHGMRKGSFTGAKLCMYINGEGCDYLHARKIINGMDCAEKIAGYAQTIEKMLIESAA